MKVDIKAAREEYQTLLEADKKFWTDADTAGEDPTAEQMKSVADRNKRIEELEHTIKDALEREGVRSANNGRRQEMSTPVGRMDTPISDGKSDRPRLATMSGNVMDDADFKAWLTDITKSGAVTRAQFGHSPAVEVKTLITGASATSGGALITNDMIGLRDPGLFMRPLTILDLITVGTTTSDTIEYAKMGAVVNNAAPVAEATATSNGSGAKPESDMALSVHTAPVKTIAHWIPATRRSLADAGVLRTMIDAFLRYGLDEEVEDQIIGGNGVGENLTGILSSSPQAQAYDTDILTTARKARTLIRLNGRTAPTAYGMHPTDWEAFDLLQDNEARYYFGGPSVLGNPRMWGLPVVESEAFTVGQAVVADWRWAAFFYREQANIMVSDSHSDFFTRNLIAILAEMRGALAVIRPYAFATIDLTP